MITKGRDGKQKKGKATVAYTWGETFIKWFCILSFLLLVLAVLPFTPWKVQGTDANLGPAWSTTKRYYTLFTATDQYGAKKSYSALKAETCNQAQQLGGGADLISSVTGALSATAAEHNPGINTWAIGSFLGNQCSLWKLCKQGVILRCAAYTTWMYTSYACGGCIFIASLLCIVSWVCLAKEFRPFPKKMSKVKQEETLAGRKAATAICCMMAFLLSLISSNLWVNRHNGMIDEFQRTSYFPKGAVSAGPVLCWICDFFLGVAAFIACYRACSSPDKDEEEEKDNGEDNGANAAALDDNNGSASDWGPPSGGGYGTPGGFQQSGPGGFQQGPPGGYQPGPPGPPPGPPGGRGPAQVQYASQYQQGPPGGFGGGGRQTQAPGQVQYASQYQQGPPGGFGGGRGY